MTICKDCKHKGIFKYPCSSLELIIPETKFDFIKEKMVYYVVDLDCCTLNKMTGKDNEYDINFEGNKYFNCGGFEKLVKCSYCGEVMCEIDVLELKEYQFYYCDKCKTSFYYGIKEKKCI